MNPVSERAAQEAVAGAWSLDVSAWRVTWSEQARRIHEYSPDHPIGVWEALDFVDPQDRVRVFASALDCFRSGVPMDVEVGLTTATGRTKRVVLSGFRAPAGAGEVPSLEGAIRELRPWEREEPQNDAATHRLLALLREWEIFGRAIPHELRSPLSNARGFAEALDGRHRGALSDTGKRYLARLLASLDQLGDLLDSLLQFAPVATRPMEISDVSLSRLAHEAIELLRARDPDRDVHVDIEEDVVTPGDPDLLRLLMVNLLGNAWKFTGHREKARIRFVAHRLSEGTVYCVADNGAGFDMYDAPRLFTPFERLHERHHFDGSGVGLALVRRVVERHGGTVWAEALPDAGASFFFTLGRGGAAGRIRAATGTAP